MSGSTERQKLNKRYLLAPALLLVVYVIMAWTHTRLAPLTTGPDELAHYEYMNFIATYGRLPQTNAERQQASYKSDQPPLYHLLAAIPASLIGIDGSPTLKRVNDHVRRLLINRPHNLWGLHNTEDETPPYAGEVLRWHVGRWVSILFGAATVWFTYFIARRVFSLAMEQNDSQTQILSLTAAAIVAFTPRFILSGSMLNYEAAVACFAALFLWALLKIACSTSHVLRTTFLLGIFAGLAITAKLSALILPLEAALGLWLVGRYYGWSWSATLRRLFVAGLGTCAIIMWWFGFVIVRFNTVAQDGVWTGLLRPLIAADPSDATTNRLLSFLTAGEAGATQPVLNTGPPWAWLSAVFRSFWRVGIEGEQPLGGLGITLALGLCLLAIYGVFRFTIYDLRDTNHHAASARLVRLVIMLLLLHLVMPIVLPFIRYLTTFSLADTAQGRHILFLAAPAFATLLVLGIYSALRFTHYRLYLVPLMAVFLFFWTLSQLYTMTWAYSPPLPVQTRLLPESQFSNDQPQPLTDYVTLLGTDTRLLQDEALLQVDVLLQATAVSPVDYLTSLSLTDSHGTVQSAWLGYSAQGRYPTRAWDKGDIVRDTAWLPLGQVPPGTYQLQLVLQPTAKFLPDQPLPDMAQPVTLGEISVPDNVADPDVDSQRLYRLWQNGQPVTQPQSIGYRETVIVTLAPPLAASSQMFQLVTTGAEPDAELAFDPVVQLPHQLIFIVANDWPAGDYALNITGPEGQVQQGEALLQLADRWQRTFSEPPMARRLDANFANQVRLLGYDLGANRAVPGGDIPLVLHWQGLDWLGDNYIIFTKLLAADQTVYGGRERLAREWYSTLYWAPGEIVSDAFGVPVDPDAPDGIYYVNVGLYKLVDEQPISLPLVENNQPIDVTSINIGPIKIGDAGSQVVQHNADPQTTLNQPFGEGPQLTLLGYTLGNRQGTMNNEQIVELTLYWRSELPLTIDYTTFVHLRNSAGETVAQQDQPPLKGAYPTSLWDSGEIIADTIVLSLPENLPPDTYQLVLGLYDLHSGQRLAVPGQPQNSVPLTSLELAP